MADLERLALQRDRKFLLRLLLLITLGVACGIFLLFGLTGQNVSGCAANTRLPATGASPER